MYYQVLKQDKQAAQGAQPELFIVAQDNLEHFLHEQLTQNVVLIFSSFPERNLYTEENDAD